MLELDPRWVVGFVDGEGCFSVSIHRNPQRSVDGRLATPSCLPRLPAREASRGARSTDPVLRLRHGSGRRVRTAACGRTPSTSLRRPRGRVVPVLRALPARSSSVTTSRRFAVIVRAMRRQGAPRRTRVRASSSRLAYAMNCGRQAAQPSADNQQEIAISGILRDCTPGTLEQRRSRREDTVRSSWRHEESGRNDLTTPQRPAAMRSNKHA